MVTPIRPRSSPPSDSKWVGTSVILGAPRDYRKDGALLIGAPQHPHLDTWFVQGLLLLLIEAAPFSVGFHRTSWKAEVRERPFHSCPPSTLWHPGRAGGRFFGTSHSLWYSIHSLSSPGVCLQGQEFLHLLNWVCDLYTKILTTVKLPRGRSQRECLPASYLGANSGGGTLGALFILESGVPLVLTQCLTWALHSLGCLPLLTWGHTSSTWDTYCL